MDCRCSEDVVTEFATVLIILFHHKMSFLPNETDILPNKGPGVMQTNE